MDVMKREGKGTEGKGEEEEQPWECLSSPGPQLEACPPAQPLELHFSGDYSHSLHTERGKVNHPEMQLHSLQLAAARIGSQGNTLCIDSVETPQQVFV